jgi:hypothetical protein
LLLTCLAGVAFIAFRDSDVSKAETGNVERNLRESERSKRVALKAENTETKKSPRGAVTEIIGIKVSLY